MTTPGPEEADARLDQLVELVVQLASGNLDARIESTSAGDRIDAVGVGLGMLAEELQVLTVNMDLRVAERTRQVADAHRQLEYLALYDQLTGLANRTLLSTRLDRAVTRAERRGGPPAVLVLDLDGFKAVNDSFGHSVGDLLLVEVAHRLRGVVREIDTVARLGGDEFAVVISHATVDQVVDVATRIQQALQRPLQAGAQQSLDLGDTVVGWSRTLDGRRLDVAINMGSDPVDVELHGLVLEGTHRRDVPLDGTLAPDEAVLVAPD